MKLVAAPAHASVSPPTVAASSSPAAPPCCATYSVPLCATAAVPRGRLCCCCCCSSPFMLFFMHEPEGWEGAHSESSLSKHERKGVCFLELPFRNVPFKRYTSECRAGFPPEPRAHLNGRERSARRDPSARGHASSAFACCRELVSCRLWIWKLFTGMKWSGVLLFIKPERP